MKKLALKTLIILSVLFSTSSKAASTWEILGHGALIGAVTSPTVLHGDNLKRAGAGIVVLAAYYFTNPKKLDVIAKKCVTALAVWGLVYWQSGCASGKCGHKH